MSAYAGGPTGSGDTHTTQIISGGKKKPAKKAAPAKKVMPKKAGK